MLALKYSHQLSWGELRYIEDPMHAIRTVELEHGKRIGGKHIQNAHLHDLPDEDDRRFDPYRFIKTKLENGQVFLVNHSTVAPAIHSLELDADGKPEYTFRNSTNPFFRSAFTAALRHIPVPKPMGILRDEPKPAQIESNKEEKPKKKKLLTIAKIARKLRMIEGSSRYEEACFYASKIGWEGICNLVEVGHPENDPNLMPSRFMILPGASDEGLRKRGNLNNYPYPVHPDTPKQMSVYNLKQFLILGGYLSGEKPYWQTKDQLTKEELEKLKTDGGLESTKVSPLTGSAEMDENVEAALNSFIEGQAIDDPLGGGSYTVKEGDTLSSIAKDKKYPNWQVIWKFNSHLIQNPDLIHPGDELELPDLVNDEFEPWFYEFDNGEEVWRGNKHYQYPANYFSLSLVTEEMKPIPEIKSGVFEAFINEPKQLYYSIDVNDYDGIKLLMPYNENLKVWAPGFDLGTLNSSNVDIRSLLSSNQPSDSSEVQTKSILDGLAMNTKNYEKADYSEDE